MSTIPYSLWSYHVLPFLDRAQLTAFGYTIDACRTLGIPPRSLDPAVFTARLHQVYEFRSNDWLRLRAGEGSADWRGILMRTLDTEKHVVVSLNLCFMMNAPQCTMSVTTNTFLDPDQTEPEVPETPGIMRFVDSATIRVVHGPGEVISRSIIYYNAALGTGEPFESRPLERFGPNGALRKVDMIV